MNKKSVNGACLHESKRMAAGSFRMQPTPDFGTQSPVKTRPKPPRQAAPTPQT